MTATAFQHVRVFDGAALLTDCTVVVRDTVIDTVEHNLAPPPEAAVIEGSNRLTLLPGLIDSHTHALGQALRQALRFGITTELDMANSPELVRDAKARQNTPDGRGIADIRSAGPAATVPGGHGTEYLPGAPTVTHPDSAAAFVEARVAEGSDYLKIHYRDGQLRARLTGRRAVPVISKETMQAVAAAAHDHGRLALAHVATLQGTRDAIEAGLNGMAHVFLDAAPASDFGTYAADHDVFIIPTLAMAEQLTDPSRASLLADDPCLLPFLADEDLVLLRGFASSRAALLPDMSVPNAAVRMMANAGVPILAGSDAAFGLHGAALHRELQLLCEAGLTPLESLTAATSAPARIFSLNDRGRVAPGLRADLLLVDGDPTKDIRTLGRIVGVWKQGSLVERARPSPLGDGDGMTGRRHPAAPAFIH